MTQPVDRQQVLTAIRNGLADILGISVEEIAEDSRLLDDLGVESIDLLDLMFRLDRETGVRMQVADIAGYLQGPIPDDEFADASGYISERGLKQLATVLGPLDEDALRGKLQADRVINLLTVGHLATLYVSRASNASRAVQAV